MSNARQCLAHGTERALLVRACGRFNWREPRTGEDALTECERFRLDLRSRSRWFRRKAERIVALGRGDLDGWRRRWRRSGRLKQTCESATLCIRRWRL